MIRTQIMLTEAQSSALAQMAHARRASKGALVREAVDEMLAREFAGDRNADLRARARSLAGKYRSGLGDLARRHDDYLAEDFRG